jgi:hypothetical protein
LITLVCFVALNLHSWTQWKMVQKMCRKLVTTYLTLFELGCACFKGTWQGSRDGRTPETWLWSWW